MLINDNTIKAFDLDQVSRGTLIYAKHSSWSEGVTGIVTEATAITLRVQFLPPIRHVLNHTFIHAYEVADGQWEIRWSSDGLQTVNVYPEETGSTDEGGTDEP